MILTFTPNPCVDKTVFIDQLEPGTKIRARRHTCIPGGKGTNVSRAVKNLGYDTTAMVLAGGPTGRHVVSMIEQQDRVRCIPCWVSDLTRTITTVLEEPVHRQTAFFEPGSKVSDDELAALLETFRAAICDAQVVTFNGTVPDSKLRPLYRHLIEIAREAGLITILDTYGAELALALPAQPYMVKPNQSEAEGLVGFPLDTDEARRRALMFFHERGVELVVISLGADGAIVSRQGERLRVRPPTIQEINPVGSGDALVAGFAIGLHEGWSLEDMARLGVAAGTANAMTWDIGHFNKEDIDQLAPQVTVELW